MVLLRFLSLLVSLPTIVTTNVVLVGAFQSLSSITIRQNIQTPFLLASLQEDPQRIQAESEEVKLHSNDEQQQHLDQRRTVVGSNLNDDEPNNPQFSRKSEPSIAVQSTQKYLQQGKSHILTIEEISPIISWTNKKGKQKVINLYGLYNILVMGITIPFWLLAMEILQRLGDAMEGFDDNRAKFDFSGKIWCRSYLSLIDSYPEIAGDISRLKDREAGGYGGACLFVANHASFLDIAVLCTVLDPVFKFIAKDSLVSYPGVGKQLIGVSHFVENVME